MVRVSPGIYTSALQFTQVAVEISRTRPLIVGGATKGPVDKPTIITSELELTDLFGQPVESNLGLLTAVEFLKSGNQMIFLRVANGEVAATHNLKGTPVSTPGVKATGTITLTAIPTDGDTITIIDHLSISKVFEFDQAIAATGSLTFTGLPVDGESVIINDGFVVRTFEFDTVAFATGTVVIAVGNAVDGDLVTLRDALGNVVTFEFESSGGVTQGNVAVTVGGSATISGDNLEAAVLAQNLAGNLDMTGSNAGGTVTFTQGTFGVAGNTVITETGTDISKTDFAGGEDLAGAAGNIAVQIGADADATAANTAAAVEAQTGFKISATVLAGVVTLTNDEPGADGSSAGSKNTALIGVVTNVANAGMSGGVNSAVTGSNVPVAIGVDKDASALNLVAAINAVSVYDVSAQGDFVPVDPVVTVTQGVAGSAGNTTILDTGADITVAGFTGGVNEVLGSAVDALTVTAATPGSWANTMTVAISATAVFGAPADNIDIAVTAPIDNQGTLQVVERFRNLSMEPTLLGAVNPRFIETVVNEGVRGEVNPSRFIVVTQLQPYTLVAGTFLVSTTTLGADGITGLTAADFVGSTSGNTSSGLKAAENKELVDFNLLATPGWAHHKDVVSAIIATCEFRGDCFGLIDPPMGLTVQDVIDWHNGEAFAVPDSPTLAINSDTVAVYWPWVRIFSNYLQKRIWLPPSAVMLSVFAFGDENPGPWFAPAGFVRGVLPDVLSIEYSPLQAERDLLLGGNNRVNPFVENTDALGTNFIVLGNATATRTAGPLDAVHVQRMVLFARKLSATSVRFILMDPNDPISWRNVEQTIGPILQNIQDQRGLDQDGGLRHGGYDVKCDADTNPPEQRAEKTLRAKILLKHIDAAEIIELDFGLIATGAEFTV